MNKQNNGLTVVPFKKRHLALIKTFLFPYMEDVIKIKGFWKHGPSYTVFHGDRIVFCAGVAILRKGLGEVWNISDIYAAKIPLSVTRCHEWFIDNIAKKYNLRRMQSWVCIDDQQSARYNRMIGFEWEGTLKGIGLNGEDMKIFGRVY